VKISQRLFLAVIPAVLGLLLVAALAYWGQRRHAAPVWVVVVAAVAAAVSLVLAWQNTRYVARRIERLAGTRQRGGRGSRSPLGVVRDVALPTHSPGNDELDSIEQVVDQLSSAVSVAQEGGKVRERAAAERIEEYAMLLDEAAAAVRRQLDEARLALHILQDSSFGGLNEHQLEMVEAARVGADAAETEMARLHDIARLDRQAISFRRDPIRVAEILRGLRSQLAAEGSAAGVTIALDLMPGLPRVMGDRIRLQQALEFLLRHLVRHAPAGNEVTVAARSEAGSIRIAVGNARAPTLDPDVALARRIIDGQGGRLDVTGDGAIVTLPVAVKGK
jgi:signal transduction histidine kinase